MSRSRSLSGHRAVGNRRAADGNRNEASKSIEFCILRGEVRVEEQGCNHVYAPEVVKPTRICL